MVNICLVIIRHTTWNYKNKKYESQPTVYLASHGPSIQIEED